MGGRQKGGRHKQTRPSLLLQLFFISIFFFIWPCFIESYHTLRHIAFFQFGCPTSTCAPNGDINEVLVGNVPFKTWRAKYQSGSPLHRGKREIEWLIVLRESIQGHLLSCPMLLHCSSLSAASLVIIPV